jgi:hypothetical protein
VIKSRTATPPKSWVSWARDQLVATLPPRQFASYWQGIGGRLCNKDSVQLALLPVDAGRRWRLPFLPPKKLSLSPPSISSQSALVFELIVGINSVITLPPRRLTQYHLQGDVVWIWERISGN